MKKTIIILSIAFALLVSSRAEDAHVTKAVDTIFTMPPFEKATWESLTRDSAITITAPKYFSVFTSFDHKEVLRVSPLPARKSEYIRPDKASEVKAELWTSDGKHWVAKWEEEKP